MVRLEELEDEHFVSKPETTGDGALLADDDEDYTDTDSSISDDDLETSTHPDESLLDRLTALRDIIPPKTRARISSATSTVYSAANSTVTYGGKGLWVIATSILLLGIPYALALGEEQQYVEEERQRGMMEQGAQGMIQPGQGEAKPAL
ncbi:mitochondrial import receptor subunit Tom22 [Cladophialophora chaetospira]|uniref:Mitochondrial import receptor subunit Tom22 n=1 Tax=Cladophialophora chaetospira TaxID=386627 RepID=A0AA38WXA7_9EURO|nr:mitochondrial import receptor subunit Tom22 [Cladophialophora chaetospira]